MFADIPTLFMVIIAAGSTLAIAIGIVAWGRDRNLLLWAGALALHSVAYILYSQRGQISDTASIVVANMALSSSFALFAEGVLRFQHRPVPRVWVWGPVVVVTVSFYLLLHDMATRVALGSILYALQSLIVVIALAQRRRTTAGRGQYLLIVGGVLITLTFAVRTLGLIGGRIDTSFTAANTLQTATFLLAVVCLMLMGFGLVIMTMERAQTQAERASRFEQIRSQSLELLASDASLPRILEALVRGLEEFNLNALCSILLLDQNGQHLTHGAAPSLPDFYNKAVDGVAIGKGVGSCGTAAFTGERAIASDIASHPDWADFRALAARAQLASCWSQPIRAASGAVLGTFAVYHRVASTPSQADIYLIEQFASLASIAIERSKAAEKIRASVAHYLLLTEGVSDVVWKLDRDFKFTYISPADERMRGFRADEVLGRHVFDLFTDEGIATIRQQLRRRKLSEAAHGVPQDSITIEVQQHCKDGTLVWTEIISTRERDADGNIVGEHGITRNITERKQAQEQVHRLAFYDSLTRLANRRLFNDRLGQALARARREHSGLGLLFIDLDNFKPVNDQHGHEAGDGVLQAVAQRINSCVRASDTAARIGGDEFVVLLPDLQTLQDALAVAEKIRQNVQLPCLTDKQASVIVTTSIGVATYPLHGTSEDALLRLGDAAMYRAKNTGGNRVEICTPEPASPQPV